MASTTSGTRRPATRSSWAIAFAIVFGMITTLILLAREDGRVEREVERRTGRGPERPGSPIHPKHDA